MAASQAFNRTLGPFRTEKLTHGFGASAANRELVRWMRAHNEGRPAAEQVRFAGFDGPLEMTGAQSPRRALTALHDYLARWVEADQLPCDARTLDRLTGEDARWTNPDAMLDPAESVGRSDQARELRMLADDLAALLDAHTPRLVSATSREDWDRARLYARTATGLLRYHFWMADTSSRRMTRLEDVGMTVDTSPSRMTRLLGLRDQMMADNLFALAERGPVLVHAHNAHLQRGESTMRMGGPPLYWWGAGAIVGARLGPEYAFLATALGTIRHRGVDTPPPDTVEGLLYGLGEERCVVDAPRLAADPGNARLTPRVSAWFGYAPLDPSRLADSDGIVFVRDLPRS
ncbi:erythromycin esterase family protein [Nocardiopsis sp. HUAS JQ3]|uniref:erythromycin esterase family protein n=1 Tax=Nocardiopsis sp. HUAS JQ3 TaxID=3061629 RepID=UPI0023A94B43|nr:erythromycin esterase family protein [Nocardiopsis sp. HUAS JQ3]WDZ93915.1 erythromycin esterase family protein [Nocardiopsis sp. HUAS JQ3]